MNKQIATIIGIVFLINLVWAITIDAGETYELELNEVPAYYEITNTTPINVNVVYDGTIALITPNKYMDGNFTITFFNEEDEPIESIGGSSSNIGGVCYRGWKTTEWSDCINNKQTRDVTIDRYGKCYQTKQTEPVKEQSCEVKDDSEELIIPETTPEKSKNVWYWIIIIGVAIVIGLIIWILVNRKDNFEDVIVQ